MLQSPRLQRNDSRLRLWAIRSGFVAFLAAVLFTLPGCPSNAPSNLVKGKVTLGDKQVAGTITFIAQSDGKTFPGGTGPDGTYVVTGLTPGTYKITVGAMPGMQFQAKDQKEKDKTKDLMKDLAGKELAGGGPGGVAPPPKYAKVETSDLTYEFKGGSQVHDIALAP